jgi:hypothetical protein
VRLSADNMFAKTTFFHSPISPNPFPCAHNRTTPNITMSFGFSVGDFLAAIQLANKIRKEFANAPSQFKAVTDEYGVQTIVRSLLNIIVKQD